MRSAWKVRLAGLPPVRLAACGSASRISSTSRALLVNGSFVALAHDRGDDPLGLLLLAVRPQDPDELARRVGVEDLGGADAGRLVHAHVERGVLGVGEAAVGLVELHGGDAEVEEHALDARRCRAGRAPRGARRRRRARGWRARRRGRAARRRAAAPPCRGRGRSAGPRGTGSSSASLWPPRPSVQSTTTAPGRSRAGASRSRHRWSITGTCRTLASDARCPLEALRALIGPSQSGAAYAPPGPRPLGKGRPAGAG